VRPSKGWFGRCPTDIWHADLMREHGIRPGAVIDCKPSAVAHVSDYPHKTEDLRIVRSSISVVEQRPRWWRGEGAVPVAATLQEIFDGALQHGNLGRGAEEPACAERR